MKNLSIFALVLVISLSFGLYPSNVLAQDPEQPAAEAQAPAELTDEPLLEFEGAEFSYGTVKSVSGDQIVVTEYDYEQDKDIDVTYSVNAETTYEGVQSMSEIAAGDSVDVDYKIEGDKKIALAVAVEKGGEDEELTLGLEEPQVAPAGEETAPPAP
jgi:hypothetical protein